MAKRKKLTTAVADAFEIPKDVMTKQVRIGLRGRESLLVENHSGIISYSPRRIICQTEDGPVEIVGENLLLDSMEADELVICGWIIQIIFSGAEEE